MENLAKLKKAPRKKDTIPDHRGAYPQGAGKSTAQNLPLFLQSLVQTKAEPQLAPTAPTGHSQPLHSNHRGTILSKKVRQQSVTKALPYADRIQSSFGRHSISGIEAHMGGSATSASKALGANAFTIGNMVAFGKSPDLHTAAHEAAHVVQQRAGIHLKDGMGQPGDTHEQHADTVADRVVQGKSAEALLDQYSGCGGGLAVQCSFSGSFPIPGSTSGFEVDMQTQSLAGGDAMSGLDGYIRFVPAAGSPNSNVITMNQIIRTTNVAGGDIGLVTMPADRRARGGLGDPGILTEEDIATGVEGGFHTDVLHRANAGAAGVPMSDPLSTRYPHGATQPGQVTQFGSVTQPAQYGGGVGGRFGSATPGFKRSDEPHDMKSTVLYDTPGTPGPGGNFDQVFESVARGEDTNINYGTVHWGQSIRSGEVTNELTPVVTAGSSATFNMAEERHRDFYVHEPVTFYFGFDRDVVEATELAKIDAFLDYLNRAGNADVRMSLQGFADQIGNVAYNIGLSRRRAENVQAAMVARRIAALRIDMPPVAHGRSTAATDATSEVPAGTGDQGGTAATGADQSREANRWANRRVVLTFRHTMSRIP